MAQLHHLASHYWNKPETANCTIGMPALPSLAASLISASSHPNSPLPPFTASPHLARRRLPSPSRSSGRCPPPSSRPIADVPVAAQTVLVRQVALPQRSLRRGVPPRPHSIPLCVSASTLPHSSSQKPITPSTPLHTIPSHRLPPRPRPLLHPATHLLDVLW